jgi:tetratricopeptide (TPR) repeat protein
MVGALAKSATEADSGQPDSALPLARRAAGAELSQKPRRRRRQQIKEYQAACQANQAWLAWQQGDLESAGRLARQALELWQEKYPAYPFYWQALWPLAAVAQANGQPAEALAMLRPLLDPAQMALPPALESVVQAALAAGESGLSARLQARLEEAIELAQRSGFL